MQIIAMDVSTTPSPSPSPSHPCYSILIQFDSIKNSRVFCKHFNGRSFNSVEDDVCHVLPLLAISLNGDDDGDGDGDGDGDEPCDNDGHSFPFKVSSGTTCRVCLEEIGHGLPHGIRNGDGDGDGDGDEDSVVCTPCLHKFHIQCLVRYDRSVCPICRFSIIPDAQTPFQSQCEQCDAVQRMTVMVMVMVMAVP